MGDEQASAEDELADLQDVFSHFDSEGDGSGSINAESLGAALRALGQAPTDKELKDMIDEIDVSGSRTISFNEFVAMMSKKEKDEDSDEEEQDDDKPLEISVPLIKLIFHEFDRAGKGHITAADVKNIFANQNERITDEQMFQMIYVIDTQSTNQGISYDAFEAFMRESYKVTDE